MMDSLISAAEQLRDSFGPIAQALEAPAGLIRRFFLSELALATFAALLCSGLFIFFLQAFFAQKKPDRHLFKASAQTLTVLPKQFFFCCKLWILASVLFGISYLSESIYQATEAICRVHELREVVAHLSEKEEIASIKVLERRCKNGFALETCPPAEIETKVEIRFEGENDSKWIQVFDLPGQEIYFSSLVFNFESSLIADGKARNLCIPYAIYSEFLPREKALPIQTNDPKEDLPLYYQLDDSNIYGMTPRMFIKRAKELMAILSEPEETRRNGIRASQGILHGSALHKVLPVGETYRVILHQADGLSLERAAHF